MIKNLKNIRKENGFTQQEVAEKLNISQRTYSDYETDKTEPTMEVLLRIAKLFNVSVDELLGRDELTQEERAAGARETIKKSITPIEDDMLYVFRQIGKHFGEQAQRDYITVGENMLKLKK